MVIVAAACFQGITVPLRSSVFLVYRDQRGKRESIVESFMNLCYGHVNGCIVVQVLLSLARGLWRRRYRWGQNRGNGRCFSVECYCLFFAGNNQSTGSGDGKSRAERHCGFTETTPRWLMIERYRSDVACSAGEQDGGSYVPFFHEKLFGESRKIG